MYDRRRLAARLDQIGERLKQVERGQHQIMRRLSAILNAVQQDDASDAELADLLDEIEDAAAAVPGDQSASRRPAETTTGAKRGTPMSIQTVRDAFAEYKARVDAYVAGRVAADAAIEQRIADAIAADDAEEEVDLQAVAADIRAAVAAVPEAPSAPEISNL